MQRPTAASSGPTRLPERPVRARRRRERLALVGAIAAVTLLAVRSPEALGQGTPAAPPPAGPRCQEAVVNPVSGFAECVKPRGVPVDPPPPRSAPTPEQCARHGDLDLEGCRAAQPPPAPAPGPQEPGGS